MRFWLAADPFFLVYEGDDDDVTPPPTPPDAEAAKKKAEEDAKRAAKTFTQEELNAIVAEERRKSQVQIQKQIKQLEDLQKSKSLSEKDREGLQSKIEELQNSMLTKEQLAAKDRERLEKAYQTEKESLVKERDTWQTRFVSSTINQAIVGEAMKAKAFDPDAMIALLGPNTRVAEDMDEEGKGLNTFTPKVKYTDADAEGKRIILDLTVEQAIKRMKDTPKYGYLFESTATGGLGAAPGATKVGKVSYKDMSHEQYLAERKKLGLARKV